MTNSIGIFSAIADFSFCADVMLCTLRIRNLVIRAEPQHEIDVLADGLRMARAALVETGCATKSLCVHGFPSFSEA